MEGEIVLGDQKYISSKRLSKHTHYTHDYISRLCREEKIKGKLIGRNWFVIPESLLMHEKLAKENNTKRGKSSYLNYKAVGKTKNTQKISERTVNNTIDKNTYGAWEALLFSKEEKKVETDNSTQNKTIPIKIIKTYISPKHSQVYSEKGLYFRKYRQNDLNIPPAESIFKKKKTFLGLFPFLHLRHVFFSIFTIVIVVGIIFFINIKFTDISLSDYTDDGKQGLFTVINSLMSDNIIIISDE